MNGGKTATVQVDNDVIYELETVENPVPEAHKKEIAPGNGIGDLCKVKVGDEITYEISYENYKEQAATITIEDKLDENVSFVKASDGGELVEKKANGGQVKWTLANVEAKKRGTVTLTVKVLAGALKVTDKKVVNGGETATVQVDQDPKISLEVVKNPVEEEEKPHKKETAPYEGTGVLGGVQVGDKITYEISYRNYKSEAATVTIEDKLDDNVTFVEASNGTAGTKTTKSGVEVGATGTYKWVIEGVKVGESGKVTLTVKVEEGALESKDGPGKVVNGGKTATVQVGNDSKVELETVENPVEEPHKKEISPYEGTGDLGLVKVGDEITYEISYKNYKSEAATVTIKDKLDANVTFVKASNGTAGTGTTKSGVEVGATGTYQWVIEGVPAGAEGTVTLTVKVGEGALKVEGKKVVNGGETATVQVGNDKEMSLEVVTNPVEEEEKPHKKETAPYEGTGVLGGVQVGDKITYEISYRNYKSEAATVTIEDELDKNVTFVSATDGTAGTKTTKSGVEVGATGTYKWVIEGVKVGESGKVTLTVKVEEGALQSKGGQGKVVNGGDSATVQVGNDDKVSLETVENPVPEEPHKKEITPYEGIGTLGKVHVGDEITYEISYKNYKAEAADVKISDQLDEHVSFVSADNGGALAEEKANGGTVKWTIKDVPAGTEGKVTLTVKVLETALTSKQGPGKVVNGGETATVQVGEDNVFTLEVVENPVEETFAIVIKKMNVKNNRLLKGVTLELHDAENHVIETWVTDETPKTISGLLAGVTYTVVEKEVPKLFEKQPGSDVQFRIDAQGKAEILSATGFLDEEGAVNVANAPNGFDWDEWETGTKRSNTDTEETPPAKRVSTPKVTAGAEQKTTTTTTTTTTKKKTTSVKTGDPNNMAIPLAAGVLALLLIAGIVIGEKRRRKVK